MDAPTRIEDAAALAATGLMKHQHRLADVPVRPLPCLGEVAGLAGQVRELLFPEVCTTEHPMEGGQLERLRGFGVRTRDLVLRERHAACANPEPDGQACPACLGWAEATAAGLLARLPAIRELLEGDVEAALDADPAAQSAAEVTLCYPGFQAIATQRIAHVLWHAGARLVARLMGEQAHARTGIDLHPGAAIGARFFIDHGTGVVVGETSTIGARVRLYQGVTIGARSVPKAEARRLHGVKRHPTLEDDVIVYANATILGGDTVIGRGAVIGGNTWVTTSVPAGARVSLDVAPRAAEAVVTLASVSLQPG